MASTLSRLFTRLESLDKKKKEVLFFGLMLVTISLIYFGYTKDRTLIYPGCFMIFPSFVMAVVYFRSQPCCKLMSPNVNNENATSATTTHQFQVRPIHSSTAALQSRVQPGNSISQLNQYPTTSYSLTSHGVTHTTPPYPSGADQHGENMCPPYPTGACQQGTNTTPGYPPVDYQLEHNTNILSVYPPSAGQQGANTTPGYPPMDYQRRINVSPAYHSGQVCPMGQPYPPLSTACTNASYSSESDLPPPPSYDEVVKGSS